ncbi:MAG: bifunctional aspartate kinase/diaminopimelate decarboxylase [Pseudomonadota bacterium]
MTTSEAAFAASEQPSDSQSGDWVVLKFGGSSVATLPNWQLIAKRLRDRIDTGHRVMVVHSAIRGISDMLQLALDSAVADEDGPDIADIRSIHVPLATAFEIDIDTVIGGQLAELRQLLAGVRLIREATPRIAARVMASGELMATAMSAAWLVKQGLPLHWHDARDLLTSVPIGNQRQDYLSAVCASDPDPELQATLTPEGIHLTQGFIARHPDGDTVVLGRGGSDTSAAYFGAKLGASRVEIWTDVPGMFSADPRIVPSARLLTELDYQEAQEIASAGGLVLHPRCIEPMAQHSIPLYVRCTSRPELPGTLVANATRDDRPCVKAISMRQGVTLLSLESIGMWHEVGFLAKVFGCFAEHGVSVGLVSTSESNVTVSLDDGPEEVDSESVERLIEALESLCRVTRLNDCVAVSLVGRKIRATLASLGSAFSVFEEHRLHLISQAANDLNLTVVVDEGQGYRLVQKLHPEVMRDATRDPSLGPTWESLQKTVAEPESSTQPWWRKKRDALLRHLSTRDCAYVYDTASVESAVSALRALRNVDRVFYAMKANSHGSILDAVFAAGLGFECVSPGELQSIVTRFRGISPDRLLYTPNFAPRADYEYGFELGAHVTLDNLYVLEHWSDILTDREVFLRVDPGQGRGHHEHVKTAGNQAKFGIPVFELERAASLATAAGCRVVGIHAHSGSGITTPESWSEVAEVLAAAARLFPDVRTLDLGGGLGIPEKPGDRSLDLSRLDASLGAVRAEHPGLSLWLEPGRFVVAEAGVLLARVTQLKGKGGTRYVGIATGMNSLIRPALYGAYHEIVNLTRLDEPATELVNIVGPICETGDKLGIERLLPPSEEGDVILIANTGAYGRVMASHYNMRVPAEESALGENL